MDTWREKRTKLTATDTLVIIRQLTYSLPIEYVEIARFQPAFFALKRRINENYGNYIILSYNEYELLGFIVVIVARNSRGQCSSSITCERHLLPINRRGKRNLQNLYQMFQLVLLFTVLAQCVLSTPTPNSLSEWLAHRLSENPEPLAYVIRLENVDTTFPAFKSKRSIVESIRAREQSLLAELIEEIDSSAIPVRQKRTLESGSGDTKVRLPRNNYINAPSSGPKDLHLKANLRFHHQSRHPNGSVSGRYAQMDPSGALKVTHYVNDDKGFREYPENGDSNPADPYQNSPTGNINVVTNSNNGHLPTDGEQHNQNRRGINPLDGNFLPPANPPYAVAPIDPLTNSPITHSAHNSVSQFSPKSPLFDKYYRPSPEEVQRTYDYHRVRTVFDPNQYRPNDMTPIPEIPRDNKQPELRSVYSEYQLPYQMRYQEPSAGFPSDGSPPAPYVTPPIPLAAGQTQDPYSQQRLGPIQQAHYPQTLDPQPPVFAQSYDGQQFVPASTYNGPYVSNTATFNQPYPTNIPIYPSPLPQNVPTYNHPPPEHIPVYNQAVAQVYNPSQPYPVAGYQSQASQPPQTYTPQIYYATLPNSQPAAAATTTGGKL